MSTEAVSVIIPAYNSSGTIADAVGSVLKQNVSVCEIIIVDDGSTDDTVRVAQDLGVGLIRLVSQKNAGPASARNHGVRVASGAWIAFLDADDVWLPDKLEKQFEAVYRTRAAFVCGRTTGRRGGADRSAGEGVELLSLKSFVRYNPVVTSSVLMKRSLFEAVSGFDEGFRGPEDYDLWMRVAHQMESEDVGAMTLLNDMLVDYRHQVGSLSLDERRFLPEVLRVLDKAYGDGGVLSAFPEWYQTALSEQHWSGSWMAFQRGSRSRAVRLLAYAWRLDRGAEHRVARKWFPLLVRYLIGRR